MTDTVLELSSWLLLTADAEQVRTVVRRFPFVEPQGGLRRGTDPPRPGAELAVDLREGGRCGPRRRQLRGADSRQTVDRHLRRHRSAHRLPVDQPAAVHADDTIVVQNPWGRGGRDGVVETLRLTEDEFDATFVWASAGRA